MNKCSEHYVWMWILPPIPNFVAALIRMVYTACTIVFFYFAKSIWKRESMRVAVNVVGTLMEQNEIMENRNLFPPPLFGRKDIFSTCGNDKYLYNIWTIFQHTSRMINWHLGRMGRGMFKANGDDGKWGRFNWR